MMTLARLKSLVSARRMAIGGLLALSMAAMACTSTLKAAPTSTVYPSDNTPTTAKTIQAATFDGSTFNLDDSLGKPVVLNFWFPSCPPCAAEMPDLEAAYRDYGDQVQFIGVQQVGIDTPTDGQKFLHELGITYPNIPDKKGEFWIQYGISSFPTTLFLDREHHIARTWNGLITPENLSDQINRLLQEPA